MRTALSLALAAAAGVAAVTVAPSAGADLADDMGLDAWSADYARRGAPNVCALLQAHTGVPGVTTAMQGVARSIHASDYQAGQIVAYSIASTCPEHTDRLHRWLAFYGP